MHICITLSLLCIGLSSFTCMQAFASILSIVFLFSFLRFKIWSTHRNRYLFNTVFDDSRNKYNDDRRLCRIHPLRVGWSGGDILKCKMRTSLGCSGVTLVWIKPFFRNGKSLIWLEISHIRPLCTVKALALIYSQVHNYWHFIKMNKKDYK